MVKNILHSKDELMLLKYMNIDTRILLKLVEIKNSLFFVILKIIFLYYL